jgi:polyisoprenoid-binding protein YceI
MARSWVPNTLALRHSDFGRGERIGTVRVLRSPDVVELFHRIMKSFLMFALGCMLVFPATAQSGEPVSETIRFDRNHSTLGFIVPIAAGISKVTGKFTDFNVDLIWDDADPSKSSVSVEIQIASVSTGLSRRDDDIRGESLLNAAVYPAITFKSTDIRRNGTEYVAIGDLTMHGVTKEIYLPVRIVTLVDENDPEDVWRSFHIAYELDRRDYGIDWKHNVSEMFVGYNITVDINLLER